MDVISTISPMAATFRSLGTSSVAEIDRALAAPTGSGGDAVSRARSKWNSVRGIPEEIIAALDGNGQSLRNPVGAIAAVLSAKSLSPAGRAQQVAQISDQLTSDVMAMAKSLRTGLDSIEEVLVSASTPPKPTTADSTAIADAKADLRMSLDAMGSNADATRRAGDLLRTALDCGDATTAWVICGPWIDQYLEARFAGTHNADMTRKAIGSVLDQQLDDPSVGIARSALISFRSLHAALALRTLLAQLPGILANVRQQGFLAAGAAPGLV
jgi:hypothetical protein